MHSFVSLLCLHSIKITNLKTKPLSCIHVKANLKAGERCGSSNPVILTL